jgi:tripeptide aminopeptidase
MLPRMTPDEVRERVTERFMRYVTYDTRSVEGADTYPSTPGQWTLLRALLDEVQGLGLADAALDEHGYLMATLPPTSSKAVPVIGLVAHVDTSPEVSGTDVRPILHRNYDGRDLVLPGDPSAVLRQEDWPYLAEQRGHDIVTASGTTLLGADDKAGVAEIVTAAEYLLAHPEIPHGPIRIAFTPDEEVGQGTKFFDVGRFGASCAYTLDGGARGELEMESFSADSLSFTFLGFNTHPGYAKGKMINSIKLAARFIDRLPPDELSPETTEGYEGYVHPYVVNASVDRTTVKLLLRDFSTPALKEKAAWLQRLARSVADEVPGAGVEWRVEEAYRNMREVLDEHPAVVEHAREAIRRAGLEPVEKPIRGGTDGSKLSFMGLPTPNLFTGEQNFHSRLEWVSTYDMQKAVEVIVHLAQVWEERS